MILYPTETIYGLGVNPFDEVSMDRLFALKGRDERKVSAWLVRNVDDIKRYAEFSPLAEAIALDYLPGRLTLVLPANATVPESLKSNVGTIGFRISADARAQALIKRHFSEHDAPLTCTSANVSGLETAATPAEIIEQFKTHRPGFTGFTEVIDDGPRSGVPSTVISVVGDSVQVIREGAVPLADITH